ncbi:MAG: 50S ribosomal protein L11 methyltransferase [bacterium]|nr:50S ribosomal protein L11 methyltransferase [bacterium]
MEVFINLERLQLRIAKGDFISEEDVRQSLNEDIKNYLKEKYNMCITFRNEVKTSSRQFIDSKYENFVIEYKKPSVNLKDEHRNQLKNYLNDLGTYSWGILTNGKVIEIYNYSYERKDFIIDESFSGEINLEQIKYICDIISNKEKLILTVNNINDLLGLESNKNIIKKIYNKLINSTNEKTKLFYNEWQKLFNLSEDHDLLNKQKKGDALKFYTELLDSKIDSVEKEYKALFSIQTYYSIVLKLVLYKIILNKTKTAQEKPKFYQDFFLKIESNELYKEHNILNLIDGDFFSWYLNEFKEEEYLDLYNLTCDIATVETNKINLLFIKFYENIFPFWVRHSMGEYYTPLYLAKDIVDNTLSMIENKNSNIKLLDPTCGSGIFVIYALNKGINNVYGIDINPLAVLTSKINYLINNFDLSKPFEIPIYLGDSTYFPSLTKINEVECFEYELTTSIHDHQTIEFVFSKDVVNELRFFQILDEIEYQIKNQSFEKSIEIIKSYKSFHYDELSVYYDKLIKTLIDLEKKNLNSIWLKLIGNYLKSGSIRNVDAIVGNPPWVRWSNLPDTYKLLIKKNCRVDGIFSKDTNSGGVDLNIAALITFITVRERLSKDGALGFIMPDSILFNKSFEGFRNMELPTGEKYYLNKVIRWNDKTEKPFNPVTLDFGEYFFSFKKNYNTEVYERKGNLKKFAFTNSGSFNNHFIVVDSKDYEEIEKVLGHNELEFHSGISLVKGGYYLLEFKNKINNKVSCFYYYETINGRQKRSNNTVNLENEIVYPYIKSDNIKDNEIKNTKYYCIYPYEYGSKEPYSLETIREKFPLFYNYFMSKKVQDSISGASKYNKRIQKTKFDVGIFRVGEYTYSDWFLATRDNTKSLFSIVGLIETDWGEVKMPLFDGHINYVSRNLNNDPITYNEVKKLFSRLTREGVKLYIKNSSDSRSISGRLYNDINID